VRLGSKELVGQMLVACDAKKSIRSKIEKYHLQNELTSPSPPRLPNVMPPLLGSPLGGFPPPLAIGTGIGDGGAGDVTRGLLGIAIGADEVD
jgi:hypothetical protein